MITIEKEGITWRQVLIWLKSTRKNSSSFMIISQLDKVFQFSRGLGNPYMDIPIAMFTKAPYPSFNQFVLARQGREQTLASLYEEENMYIDPTQ